MIYAEKNLSRTYMYDVYRRKRELRKLHVTKKIKKDSKQKKISNI